MNAYMHTCTSSARPLFVRMCVCMFTYTHTLPWPLPATMTSFGMFLGFLGFGTLSLNTMQLSDPRCGLSWTSSRSSMARGPGFISLARRPNFGTRNSGPASKKQKACPSLGPASLLFPADVRAPQGWHGRERERERDTERARATRGNLNADLGLNYRVPFEEPAPPPPPHPPLKS